MNHISKEHVLQKINTMVDENTSRLVKNTKNGELDFRYSVNRKIFRDEYKRCMLEENRKYNVINLGTTVNYRDEILNMSEEQLLNYFK